MAARTRSKERTYTTSEVIHLLALNEECGEEALSVNAAELDAESSDEDSPIGDGTSLNGSSLLVPSVPVWS